MRPKQTAAEVQAAFTEEFYTLLRKYQAEAEVTEDGININIPAIYNELNQYETARDYTNFDLPRWMHWDD